MRVLVDADVQAYACGFATQASVVFDKEKELVVEPVEHALAMCKRSLEGIYTEVSEWLSKSGESVSHLELYLTGKNNFRDKIATIRGYKENRKDKPKPVHYKAIRDYMADSWGAKVVDGYEADDAVAMEAAALGYDADRIMICSVDKDLKTVPGYLYSFKKKEGYLLTPAEASYHFYRQMITGDTIDNILGIYKSGEKKAAALLREGMSDREMWDAVLAEFRESVTRKGCPYTDPLAAAIETARLLHLLRHEGEIWQPPTE